MRSIVESGGVLEESFLKWHRTREYDDKGGVRTRGAKANNVTPKTPVCACRYWYELTDGYWGQYVLTQIPHLRPEDILPQE